MAPGLPIKDQVEKLLFLQLRDGTGFIQGVVVKAEVEEEVFSIGKIHYTRNIPICNRDVIQKMNDLHLGMNCK